MSEENEKVERTIEFEENIDAYIRKQAHEEGITPEEFVESVLTDRPFALIAFEETTGKVSMQIWSPDPTQNIGSTPSDGAGLLKEYRRLRDEFPPVSAGVNYHKRFMLGTGFEVEIDDPLDPQKKKIKESIEKWNKDIYQDYYNKGLWRLLDPLVDEALTVGCSAAEIVYNDDENFNFIGFSDDKRPLFVEQTRTFVNQKNPKGAKVTVYETRDLEAADWKKLKGIVRLKFIEEAVSRMVPYRDPFSEDLRYWIVDRAQSTQTDTLNPKEVTHPMGPTETHLHPWQVFWLVWNMRGLNMHGTSIVKAVYKTARLMEIIIAAMGKGYQRWADKKYFFVTGTEKKPWGRTAVRGFTKAMELMIKNNWTGVPVPAGFDLKEMGGTVFDARNFLDFLSTLICSGMNYPKDFLLQESKAGENKESWIAWQNTYGFNQKYLGQSIENQLWEKQLWGTMGQTYRVKKQGVSPRKREKREIFVPLVQWRSETKWLIDERMDLLTGMLNVANPISPQLKLGAEKDMALTLGLSDVVFPTTEELQKSLKKDKDIEETKAEVDKLRLQVELIKLEYMMKHPDVITEPLEMAIEPEPQEEPEKEKTSEEKLEEQAEKRQEGGVSRTTKESDTESKKGVARPLGSTRKPTT